MRAVTRRAALAGITTAAIARPAASMTPDPVFAAIERHKAASVLFDAACDVQVTSDAHLDAAREAGHAADAIAIEMIETRPTTLAGILALLRYTADFPLDGHEWPDDISGRWPERFGHAETLTWGDAVCGNLAQALAGILAGNGGKS